jgi:hypothetical protein
MRGALVQALPAEGPADNAERSIVHYFVGPALLGHALHQVAGIARSLGNLYAHYASGALDQAACAVLASNDIVPGVLEHPVTHLHLQDFIGKGLGGTDLGA